MFEYMDGIVDAVEEIGQAAVDVAAAFSNMAAGLREESEAVEND